MGRRNKKKRGINVASVGRRNKKKKRGIE